MTPEHVISQLLESNVEYPNNLELLKKIILTASLGRLQINGQPPDKQITLGNYLFDNERIMFDVTRLSDNNKKQFYQWLLENHQSEKQINFFSSVSVNEYRGFTAEVALSWWGIFINWFKGVVSEFWIIKELELSLDYQMTAIEMSHGQSGTLIGFNQYLVPSTDTKYKDLNDPQREPLGNTKRVFLTDRLVQTLTQSSIEALNVESLIQKPHPHSIAVVNPQSRLKDMYDYRTMQKYLDLKPWYARLWTWFLSWFETPLPKLKSPQQELDLLYENDTTRIYQRTQTKELIVVEKKPEIDILVLCGGGSKIYGHVGVWKALLEAGVIPRKFAGSSAGAIISLLCYLGYSSDELIEFTREFRQEHIVHFDIDSQGFSSTQSLKTALDYIVSKKIMEIVTQYKVPYPKGVIDFATLESLRKQCPGCGIGKELVVTATNKKMRKTRYFSLKHSPQFEVAQAVAVSASLPVLYKPTLIDGEEHNDGGVLSNFPTEAFSDDNSTLLESEYGNNLKLLAIQFNNGTERDTIDKVMDKVYKENFIINWIYRLLTGVEDPASGWEQDRMKLRKYSAQSIIIDFEEMSNPASLLVEEREREKRIEKGYLPTKDYLRVRHSSKEGLQHKNQELMYSTFSSLGDLLAYCCYRGNKPWFDIVRTLIEESSLPDKSALIEQSQELEALYFNTQSIKTMPKKEQPLSFFSGPFPQQEEEPCSQHPGLLLAIYPVFMKTNANFVQNKAEKKLFEQAIHSLSIESPWECLDHFAKIKGNVHILLHILINSLHSLRDNPTEQSFDTLKIIQEILASNPSLIRPEFFGQWNLTPQQNGRMLKVFKKGDLQSALNFCNLLSQGLEPLQTVKNGVYSDEIDNEEESASMCRI